MDDLSPIQAETGTDSWTVAGRTFTSRLIVGTGKYKDYAQNAAAARASGAQIVTVALRRVNLSDPSQPMLVDYVSPERFTYVLIDCPPSLNLLTVNAMAAADAVFVPLQCEFFALEGLSQLMRTVELVRGSLNPSLELQGVVLTMYDRRNSLSEQVASDVRAHFGDKVYETVIPRNVRVSEAPSFGKPVLIYDLKCAGSQAYLKLAREVVNRERARQSQAA